MTTLYEPTEWVSGSTPMSASAFNKIEQGIRAAKAVGEIWMSFQDEAEPGSLKLDGATISRTTFEALFNYVVEKDLIGPDKPFGNGDGETTFVLPDMRQRFLRMAPSGNGGATGGQDTHEHVNPRTGDAPNHVHGNPNIGGGSHNHGGSTGLDSAVSGQDRWMPNEGPDRHQHSISSSGSLHTHTQGDTHGGGAHDHFVGETNTVDNRPAFFEINCFIAT